MRLSSVVDHALSASSVPDTLTSALPFDPAPPPPPPPSQPLQQQQQQYQNSLSSPLPPLTSLRQSQAHLLPSFPPFSSDPLPHLPHNTHQTTPTTPFDTYPSILSTTTTATTASTQTYPSQQNQHQHPPTSYDTPLSILHGKAPWPNTYSQQNQQQQQPQHLQNYHSDPLHFQTPIPVPGSSVTVSPISAAHKYESPLCVSPLSVSNNIPSTTHTPFDPYHLPTSKLALPNDQIQQQQFHNNNQFFPKQDFTPKPQNQAPVQTQQQQQQSQPQQGRTDSHIDDSLIARLRGFSDRNTINSASIITASKEPQIRDTTESLAMGFGDSSAAFDGVSYATGVGATTALPDKPHACRKCSATFRRRDNLMAHIRAQHKGERPFKCEKCGFRFIKKDHAMKHWKVVHLKERPFQCNRCGNRFGQRSDLNKHVRSVHLKIKPFACEHCGLRFSHRGNQIRHQAVVHEKRKPYPCSECDSSFAEKSNLTKHCQAVHKNSVLSASALRTTQL